MSCLSARGSASRKRSTKSRSIVADLVIGRHRRGAQLQPVERRFAGQRRAVLAPRGQLAGHYRQDRVVAQLVVIDHVLVAQRNAENALPDQRRYRVLDQLLRPAVAEASGKPRDQADRPVGCAQQQTAGVRGELAAVKRGHHHASFDRCKTKQVRATLCRHRAPLDPETNRSCNTIFPDSGARCTYPFEKSRLKHKAEARDRPTGRPGVFGLPAGIGDMLTGMLPVPAAIAVATGTAQGRRAAVAWNLLGLADFAVAVTLGAITSPGPTQLIVPDVPSIGAGAHPGVLTLALVVPSSILLHALSLRQLRRRCRAEAARR